MKPWDRFLKFESENKLFEYRDSFGKPVWDILRYYVYNNIQHGSYVLKDKPISRIYAYKLYCLLMWIPAFFVRGKSLFFLSSRNKMYDKQYDKNAADVMKQLQMNENIIIETYCNIRSLHLDHHAKLLLPELPFAFLSSIFCTSIKYDFSELCSLIKSVFSESTIKESELLFLYRNFYLQKKIYTFFLKHWHIKSVFMTQNGIQKGLIAACKELNILIYEFQHGIVDTAHMAYSYPQETSLSNCYLPNVILSLSNFWFKDLYLPGTSIIPIGNSSFSTLVHDKKENTDRKILVVSANIYGNTLKDFVKLCLADSFFTGYYFYFKLHPNQFAEEEFYNVTFENNNNVEVITDKYDIPTLLNMVDTTLIVVSTASYEALQNGCRVCIYKRDNYMDQERIFNNPNVSLINTVEDFKYAIQKPLDSNRPVFFSPFDAKLFINSLKN